MGKSLRELIFEVIYEHEEPCEVRVLCTVLWERGGEIPLRDPIRGHFAFPQQKYFVHKS